MGPEQTDCCKDSTTVADGLRPTVSCGSVRSRTGRTVSAVLLISAACLVTLAIAGAAPPADAPSSKPAPAAKWWAFVLPSDHQPPTVQNSSWTRNPIDHFVLAQLEQSGLSPAPEAPKESLIRRAYLDLIGIPPTPQEVDEFVADPSADAFDKVVDGLLASPHYGERWARHWLDLARYAESEGFKADETRPYMWRYRDYVIQSLNEDKRYDRFIREQIAGDELWPDDPQAKIATGFLRCYPDESNARKLDQRRQEILNDVTDTVGSTFLGLTVGCARCHDHKYDPIPQRDYYRLQAFFAALRADDHIPVASPQEIREHDAKLAIWEEKTKDIRDEMAKLEEPKRKAILKDYFDKYPDEIRSSLLKPSDQRTPMDWVLHYKAAQYMEPDSYQYLAPASACVAGMKPEAKTRWNELKQELDQDADLKPADLPLATGIADAGPEAPKTYLLNRGVYDAFKAEVQPGFPTALGGGDGGGADIPVFGGADISVCPESGSAGGTPSAERTRRMADKNVCPTISYSTGRRTALANWLASADNPLTARVIVNRIWQHHFGRGIVATPSDFGVQGERPSHPELLDWLAVRFVRDGWSLKKLHRLIMTSSVYRESTGPDSTAAKLDPDDRLLWRFPRKRLEAEVIRDSALSVAGLLKEKMGGPSVFPEIPRGLDVRGGWPVSKDISERNRRSIYVFVRRNVRYPMFEAFDMPDPYESCPRRFVTTTASQALMLLNSKLTLDWAQHLAGRVLSEAGPDHQRIADTACRLACCRHASPEELGTMTAFLENQSALINQRLAHNEQIVQPDPTSDRLSPTEGAAVVDLCHVLLNSNQFVYSD